MENESIAQATQEFNHSASGIFFHLLAQFKQSVSKLDRQRNDNVFQRERAKHLDNLKSNLDGLARELIYKHQHAVDSQQLSRAFIHAIDHFLAEFKQHSGYDN